jgi:PleD family two-component response regulator
VHVTASAGVAVGDDLADADQLLDAADGALYRAKSEGRDRVVAGAAGSADVRE